MFWAGWEVGQPEAWSLAAVQPPHRTGRAQSAVGEDVLRRGGDHGAEVGEALRERRVKVEFAFGAGKQEQDRHLVLEAGVAPDLASTPRVSVPRSNSRKNPTTPPSCAQSP
jgi:hypothetical protein